MGDLRVVPIPAALVPEVWDEAAPLIDKALAYTSGRFELEDIEVALAEGRMSLVVTFDGGEMIGAMTVEIVDYPRLRALRVIHVGGERYPEWMMAAKSVLDDGARRVGATRLEMEGRPGWERIFKGLGTKIAVVIEREVDDA